MVAFISGHRNVNEVEWKGHYKAALDKAIFDGHDFVICDYQGVDTLAQAYLYQCGVRNVTVYHMFDKPRVNLGDWPTKGGYISDTQRDTACTEASDYDIAWSRTPNSGTDQNIQRRKLLRK